MTGVAEVSNVLFTFLIFSPMSHVKKDQGFGLRKTFVPAEISVSKSSDTHTNTLKA